MAALAKRFGVAVPSLYKHVPSLPAVRRALAVQALRELTADLREATAPPKERQAMLRDLAAAYRRYAQTHPGRYAAILRAPDPSDHELVAGSEQLLQVVYGVLALYGRRGEAAVHDVRALRAALHGFVSLEAAGGFGMPVDVEESFLRMIANLDAALRSDG